MNPILFVILLTAATGVGGLALGGALAALVRRESPRGTSLLLSFTAGLMLSIVALDMVPEAMEAAPWPPMTPLVLVAGFVVTYLLNCWIDKSAHHEDENNPHHCACGHHDLHTAGLVLAAAVALHNMPVGMAIGAAFAGPAQAAGHAGILAAIIIGLHNIPEGMSIAAPLLTGGSRPAGAVGVAALSGLPTILGALLGYTAGVMNPVMLSVSLGFAAGAMLYVVFGELLPEAEQLWQNRLSGVSTLLGMLLGMALIFLGAH